MAEEKKKKARVTASAVLDSSVASKYNNPNLYTVATKITADNDSLFPISSDDSSVFIKSTKTFSFSYSERVCCGLSIELPQSHKLVFRPTVELATAGVGVEGMIIEGRIYIILINNGSAKTIDIKEGVPIARMYIEPAYWFEWV